VRPQFCIALPEVDDLEVFARTRRLFLRQSVRDRIVSGTADAALRVMAELQAADLLQYLRASQCHVASFGVTPWASQQKTRIEVFEVHGLTPVRLRIYQRAFQLLSPLPVSERLRNNSQEEEEEGPGQPRWETSPILDLMARNLTRGQPWWRYFARLLTDTESRKQIRDYEYLRRSISRPPREGGLSAMVAEPEAFDSRAAETIVRACHETWRRRLGALAERSRGSGESFQDLAERERERLRVSFVHCKNATTLRAVLTDFWSRAGGTIPELQQGWLEVLPYLIDERWQLARDLALLALASYAAPERAVGDGQN
jgi:CRISPR-associated protein Cas8a1/Csx13